MPTLKTVCLITFFSSAALASSFPTTEELNARVRANEIRAEQQRKAKSDAISREVNERFENFYRSGRMYMDERETQVFARGTRRSISQAWTQGTRLKSGRYGFKNSIIMTDGGFFCKEGGDTSFTARRYDCHEMDGTHFTSFVRDFMDESESRRGRW